MEIKNLKKLAKRILKAVERKEKIIIYGDADPDGITSVVILKEALEILGAHLVSIYFPDREKEGYGLNEKALRFLKPYAPALLFTLDCGIGNIKEVKMAKEMGFEVLIIDHHEVLSQMPDASIIVDPKQKSDKYPFKQLSAAGVVYKLAKVLLAQNNNNFKAKNFLELAAISTIADQMPLEKDNKELVEKGLMSLNKTKRPGLKILMELTDFDKDIIGLGQKIEEFKRKLLAPLNIWEAENHQSLVYFLLTEKSQKKAQKLAKTLLKKAEIRKEKIREIFAKVELRLKTASEKELFVFEGYPSWPLILAGPIASRICHKYKKPTFIFKKGRAESVGSLRMPSDLNGVEALKSCSHLFKTYGGHAQAAGFRLKTKNLKKFKECLTKYFTSH